MNNFWYLVLGALAIAFIIFREQNAKKSVKDYMAHRGYRNIVVKTIPFGGGRDTLVFGVDYTDHKGQKRENFCTVHTGLFSDSTIYWEKPLGTSRTIGEDNDT